MKKNTPAPIKTKFFEDFEEMGSHAGIWNERHEMILKMWAEESVCLQKMHDMAHSKYELLNIKLTLPVIIMSTLTGTANFSLASFTEPWKSHIPIIIGSINLLSGMVTTISQYLRVNESSEGHRVAALAYGKMARVVTSELTLSPEERSTDGISLVRRCRAELDRLEEMGPDVGDDIINKFLDMYEADIRRDNIYLPSNVNLKGVVIYEPDNKDLPKRNTSPDSALNGKRRAVMETISSRRQRKTSLPRLVVELSSGESADEEKSREGDENV